MEVVTVTCTVPADSAGEIAVSEVAELYFTLVAAVEPNFTVADEVKFVPVIVTLVPPAVDPEVGFIDEIVGVVDDDDPTVRLAVASM